MNPPLNAAFGLPDQEAIKATLARQQGGEQVTYDWRDFSQAMHARAFTVSRLAQADILKVLHDGIAASVQGDLSRRDWMKNAQQLLQEAGWWGEKTVLDEHTGETVSTRFTPARLRLIYETNIRATFAAGARERSERTRKLLPYLKYVHYRYPTAGRARPEHAALDGMVLPKDHPFWQKGYPPNGWNCKCMALSQTEAQAKKGKPPPDDLMQTRTWENPRTGEIREMPKYVTPGWDSAPGTAGITAMVEDKLKALPASIGAALAAAVEKGAPDVAREMDAAFAGFVEMALAAGKSQRKMAVYAAMTQAEIATFAAQTGQTPASAALLMDDRLIVGAKARRHEAAGDALSEAEWKSIPQAMADKSKRQAYFDTVKQNMVYALPSEDSRTVRLAVAVDFVMKGDKKGNLTRSVFKIAPGALEDRTRYVPVKEDV
ncbi:phage head morphogenesis protein [Betaproteobacteria bacterium]|nr:phage head morphogenesis protein [Betaproteobacteria bacterium]